MEVDFIEPHAHMVSRTTDDYEQMALAGCRVICEPAFWAGYDRSSARSFYDYFHQLTTFEPSRASRYGIAHYAWLCINPKESEDTGLAREVLSFIPEFLSRPNVLGIGEIGLNKNSRKELEVLHLHLEMAEQHDQLILVHTPHLEDKLKGTRLTLDAIKEHRGINPGRVVIDHVEEHTVELVLDAGHWAGMTLYPQSKCSIPRAVDIMEIHGTDRLWMNSACDWGVSDSLAIPRAMLHMRQRGFESSEIRKMVMTNPATFLGQSRKFTEIL